MNKIDQADSVQSDLILITINKGINWLSQALFPLSAELFHIPNWKLVICQIILAQDYTLINLN